MPTSTIMAILAPVLILIVVVVSAIRILPEYERGVVFQLGRLRPTDYGPGLFLLIPIVDRRPPQATPRRADDNHGAASEAGFH